MVNFKLLPYRDYRNNIKTCIALPVVHLNIFVGGIYDIPDFSGSYGFFGCLFFYYPFFCYDFYFSCKGTHFL